MATQAQLAQSAINIAGTVQERITTGQGVDYAVVESQLAAAIVLLGQAILNNGGGTVTLPPELVNQSVSPTVNVAPKGR